MPLAAILLQPLNPVDRLGSDRENPSGIPSDRNIFLSRQKNGGPKDEQRSDGSRKPSTCFDACFGWMMNQIFIRKMVGNHQTSMKKWLCLGFQARL